MFKFIKPWIIESIFHVSCLKEINDKLLKVVEGVLEIVIGLKAHALDATSLCSIAGTI